MNPNELPSVPPLPEGIGEPVFNEPWEASAFAIAVSLNQAGLFTWNEWVECLSNEIKEAETAHHESGEGHYYHTWFAALEKLIVAKKVLDKKSIDSKQLYLRENPVPHDHDAKREPVAIAPRVM
jgi:nitrile hydratase accessory protein